MTDIPRRNVLSSLVACSTLSLGGCLNSKESQTLGFWSIRLLRDRGNTTSIQFQINYGETGLSLEERGFTNVRVVAFDDTGDEVARKSIGDVPSDTEPDTEISLECTGFPHLLTYDAGESVCDSRNEIMIARYQGTEDGDHVWREDGERECDEGLPPAPLGE